MLRYYDEDRYLVMDAFPFFNFLAILSISLLSLALSSAFSQRYLCLRPQSCPL